MESAWIRRFAGGSAAIGVLLAVAATTLGATPTRWLTPQPCPQSADLRRPTPAPQSGDRVTGWFHLDPVLDRGTFVGQTFTGGWLDGPTWVLGLQPESFATGPTGALIVVGDDDGRVSTISILDVLRGCIATIATSSDVIRQAVLSPDGAVLYEHRIRRGDRTDLGIWRRALGAASAKRVVAAIPADPAFGPTWSTDLAWSLDGDALAISTCGERACRTRILDPSTGGLQSVIDPDLGPLIGLTDAALIVRRACPGLPCPLVAVDRDDGHAAILVEGAGRATLVEGADGLPAVVLEVEPGGSLLRSIALAHPNHQSTHPTLRRLDQPLARPFDEVAR
jgi:hypothetical protein